MLKKIGFWSVFALVTGSQIGSSTLIQPTMLAPYGLYGVWSWVIAGMGAICLALVFANLCSYIPKTGGPHAYVYSAFGPTLGFFTAWTYWVISWISNTAVIVTAMASAVILIGKQSPEVTLLIEIFLLLIITAVNLKGIVAAGCTQLILSVLKLLPLIIIPIFALFKFDINNIVLAENLKVVPASKIISSAVLFMFWGFIGLEIATTPAESVKDPCKTIPRAIIWGTLCVVLVYVVNSISILGLIPGAELAQSASPYVDASRILFGGSWSLVVALVATIVCIGTLNSWVLSSSQVSLGSAQDGLLPQKFAKKNANGAPYFGLLISSAGTIPFLVLTNSESFSHQVMQIIDISVTSFLFVYLACCLSCIKIFLKNSNFSIRKWTFTLFATFFCFWELYSTSWSTLLVASLFTLSGLPGYFIWYKRKLSGKRANISNQD